MASDLQAEFLSKGEHPGGMIRVGMGDGDQFDRFHRPLQMVDKKGLDKLVIFFGSGIENQYFIRIRHDRYQRDPAGDLVDCKFIIVQRHTSFTRYLLKIAFRPDGDVVLNF
jgi:hypothetical protein